MKKAPVLASPPYLQAVYLREDFDLTQTGSAFARDVVPEPEFEPTGHSTTFLDDDDFLQSLVAPEPESQARQDALDSAAETLSDSPTYRVQQTNQDILPRSERFPFSLPWVQNSFELRFPSSVTFLVGENGSGKSTLLEAVASLCGFPISGGGTNEASIRFGPEQESELAHAMYPEFKKRHRDGYFFRAEFYAHFASLLEQRRDDPDFDGDPYRRYGGQSLHTRSHGESFLALLQNRFNSGLFLMDEPESALSPQRQLTLLAMIADRVERGSQFVIATHSPILMTYPGATIVNFDSANLDTIAFDETEHYTLTRGILENPAMYWQHLQEPPCKSSHADSPSDQQ